MEHKVEVVGGDNDMVLDNALGDALMRNIDGVHIISGFLPCHCAMREIRLST